MPTSTACSQRASAPEGGSSWVAHPCGLCKGGSLVFPGELHAGNLGAKRERWGRTERGDRTWGRRNVGTDGMFPVDRDDMETK